MRSAISSLANMKCGANYHGLAKLAAGLYRNSGNCVGVYADDVWRQYHTHVILLKVLYIHEGF
jgi:hypothetical protein